MKKMVQVKFLLFILKCLLRVLLEFKFSDRNTSLWIYTAHLIHLDVTDNMNQICVVIRLSIGVGHDIQRLARY